MIVLRYQDRNLLLAIAVGYRPLHSVPVGKLQPHPRGMRKRLVGDRLIGRSIRPKHDWWVHSFVTVEHDRLVHSFIAVQHDWSVRSTVAAQQDWWVHSPIAAKHGWSVRSSIPTQHDWPARLSIAEQPTHEMYKGEKTAETARNKINTPQSFVSLLLWCTW